MNFSHRIKKMMVFLVVGYALAITPIPVYATPETPEIVAQNKHDEQPKNIESQLNEQELHDILLGMRDLVAEQHHVILSRIDAIGVMVGNSTIKLSTKEKEAFLHELTTIRTEAKKLLPQFTLEKQDLATILAFNKILIAYLHLVVKKKCRGIPHFTFSYEPVRAPLIIEQLFEQWQDIGRSIKASDLDFQHLGVSTLEKVKRKLFAFDKKYGVSAKMITTSLITFFILLARYALRENKRDRDAMIEDKSVIWWFNHSLSENRIIQHIDSFVGEKPYEQIMLNGLASYNVKRTGSGFFGTIHNALPALTTILLFAAGGQKFINEGVDGINIWKTLNKNPLGFLKFKELFNNEKQVVSPIEELFLLNALEKVEPTITFDDIAGLKQQKQELIPVIRYLMNPDIFEKTGTSVEKGYLLYGPTRTGKTHLAEALAGELILKCKKDLAFLKIKGSELRYIGIKKVLNIVQKYAPCIVFIDEIDLLNLQRDQNATLLEEFLTGMKTNEHGRQVIFLAATNRIDHIDHALLQPGRFGKIITFENPCHDDRKAFFKTELMRRNLYDTGLIDLDRLAHETEQCSFGDLASILNDALSQATQRQQKLFYVHFDHAIDTFKRKIAQTTIHLPEEEKQIIAAHLAGQALAYTLLSTTEFLHKVTMLPIQKKVIEEKIWLGELAGGGKKITNFGDVFTLHKQNTGGFETPEQKLNHVKALLAGHVAEKVLLGSSGYSYRTEDTELARQIVESLVFKGIKKEHFSRSGADEKLDEVMKLLTQCEEEVTHFLQEHKEQLSTIAQALQKHLTLTAENIDVLLNTKLINS